jgi:hypothetical protein
MASSLPGGYFVLVSLQLVEKEAFVSWVNAPRDSCRFRDRTHENQTGPQRAKSYSKYLWPPPDATLALTFPQGARAVRQ